MPYVRALSAKFTASKYLAKDQQYAILAENNRLASQLHSLVAKSVFHHSQSAGELCST
jgi:hypothetical protein